MQQCNPYVKKKHYLTLSWRPLDDVCPTAGCNIYLISMPALVLEHLEGLGLNPPLLTFNYINDF